MRWLNQQWYGKKNLLAYCLSPLSLLYKSIISLRRLFYCCGLKKITHFPVPVIVVGNITVGGTGKTPLVAWFCGWLQSQGFKPGIVSRGYGGKAMTWPQNVTSESNPRLVGDEAVLLAKQTQCPVVVAPNRVEAVTTLLHDYACNIIISDDGLQHYAMGRDIEIAVINGMRRFGNELCLPAGPLREPIKRLNSVDCIVVNGKGVGNEFSMSLIPGNVYNIKNPEQLIEVASLSNKPVHAVAGIGHPQRFFQQLENMGFTIIRHEFPDHHAYQPADFNFGDDAIIIMTAKDAVKCSSFADSRYWCLPVNVEVDDQFKKHLLSAISKTTA